MILRFIVQVIILILCFSTIIPQNYNNKEFKIGLIEYEPGDWNSDQTALSELIKFIHNNTNIPIMSVNRDDELKMKIGSSSFFKTQYIYMTGHGEIRKNQTWQGIKLKDNEIKALRKHLLNGGFLHVDDNYNFDKTFFSEMKKETVGSYLSYLSQWNTQIVNIRAVDKNKTKEGPSFKDYVDNLPDYELIDKKQISADFKEKLGETRTSSALYFKKK